MAAPAPSPFLAISANILGVQDCRRAEQLRFYADLCGMNVHGDVAFFGDRKPGVQGSVALEFPKGSDGGNGGSGKGAYWKIGIGLADVNAAVEALNKAGVQVGPGSQFRDVGFLTHLIDPAGYTIELLQDTFEQNFKPPAAPPSPSWPLANEAPKVGQITLRVSNIGESVRFYRDVLGMKLLCQYPVVGFSLYFLAFTGEEPLDADPNAVQNREWTYSRPYTTLELQHVDAGGQSYDRPEPGAAAWQGLVIEVTSMAAAAEHLKAHGLSLAAMPAGEAHGAGLAHCPDGYNIWLRPVSG